MIPVEVDQSDHIKVLIKLLESPLKSWDLGRFTGGIGHFVKDSIPHQAVLFDVLVMVGHIDVTLEPVFRMVGVDISPCIDALVKAPQHHCKR